MKRFSGLVEDITRLDLKLVEEPWAFAENERKRIDQHWQALVDANDTIWNGGILIAHDVFMGDGLLSARFSKTDYASFMAWRDWGYPDKSAFNLFGMPALKTKDGVLVMGKMADHTLNAGKIYPPGGSLETRDVNERNEIDLEGSMEIEMKEETGFELSTAKRQGAYAIMDGQRLAYLQQFTTELSFVDVQNQFSLHADEHKELQRLVPIRSRRDISDAMPLYAMGIVEKEFRK